MMLQQGYQRCALIDKMNRIEDPEEYQKLLDNQETMAYVDLDSFALFNPTGKSKQLVQTICRTEMDDNSCAEVLLHNMIRGKTLLFSSQF